MLRFVLISVLVVGLCAGRCLAKGVELEVDSAQIKATKANGTPWDTANGLPDPYVLVRILPAGKKDSKLLGKTSVKKDTLKPRWNEQVGKLNPGDMVTIKLWDKDIAVDDLIGKHQLTVTDALLKQRTLRLSVVQVEQLQLLLRSADAAVVKRPEMRGGSKEIQPVPAPSIKASERPKAQDVRADAPAMVKGNPTPLTAEQIARLKERDGLVQQAKQLRAQGKYQGALAPASRALALTRMVRREEHAEVIQALERLAQLHELAGKPAEAGKSRKQILALRIKLDGEKHWRVADARLALAFTEKVAALGEADRAKVKTALHKEQEAVRLYGQDKYAEVERVALEVLDVYRVILGPQTVEVARVWHLVGRSQLALKDNRGAKETNEQVLAIRRKALPKDHPDIAQSLTKLGIVQYALREYEEARKSDEEALAIRRRALPKNHLDIATSLNNLGLVQSHLREYDGARKSDEEALAIRRRALPKNHLDIASSLYNLGNVQDNLRDHEGARKSHEEALAIRHKALPTDHPDIATSLNNLGLVQSHLRDYEGARKSHEEALAIYRKALPKDHPDIARSLNNLGNVQNALRDYEGARKSHEEALAIYRKALPKDHPDIARSLNNLGNVQDNLRDHEGARKSHEEALAIRRKALPRDHPDIANSLNSLGVGQYNLRDHEGARKSHEEALAIRRKALPRGHPDVAQSLNNLGVVQSHLRDYEGARKSHEEALAIRRKALPRNHPDISQSLNNLGFLWIVSGKEPRPALTWLDEAIQIKQRDLSRLAIAQSESDQFRAAGETRNSLGLLLSLASRIDQEHADTAYAHMVGFKGAVTTRQRWARRSRDITDHDTATLLSQLRQTNQDIQAAAGSNRPVGSDKPTRDVVTGLRDLAERRARLERELASRSPAFRDFLKQVRLNTSDVRAALPEGAALLDLVDYLHTSPPADGQQNPTFEQRVVAFVVRPGQKAVVMVPLGPSKVLADLTDRWRASYGAGKTSQDGVADPGIELRKKLWEPLEKHLNGAKVVLVSPDGPLHGLPWAALPGSKEGTFLVHEHAFTVVPVPQLLPDLLKGAPGLVKEQPSLLLAGGIDFGEGQARAPETTAKLPAVPPFRPLRGTESEVNDLQIRFQRAFPKAPTPKVLSEAKATKQAFLAAAPSHRFVHLATHGFFAAESEKSALSAEHRTGLLRSGMGLDTAVTGRHPGLLSGVVFAGVNRADRRAEETILTALEAAELVLDKVELVVLSACETGRGQVADGEGVLGLQRAFQLAGTRSVVASLWKVPDEETHQLMREFYRRVWAKEPVSRAEALRQAQLWMLENWKPRGVLERPAPKGPPPPYVWAAFVLSGDWR